MKLIGSRIVQVWAVALLLSLLLWLLVQSLADGNYPLDRRLLQILLLPVLVVGMGTFPILGGRIPWLLLVSAGVLAVTSFLLVLAPPADARRVLIAPLQGDQLEVEARILRERLRQQGLRGDELYVQRHFQEITNNVAAQQLLQDRPDVAAVVWGSTRWLNISLPPVAPKTVAQLRRGRFKSAQGDWLRDYAPYQLLLSVRSVGLSLEPPTQTAEFIALLTSAKQLSVQAAAQGEPALQPAWELDLLSAAAIQSPWIAQAHRAYPWWLVGTWLLHDFLSAETFAPGKLTCALEAFKEARRLLAQRFEPELYAAIVNNQMLAESINRMIRPQTRVKAREQVKVLRRAWRAGQELPQWQSVAAFRVLRENLKVLRGKGGVKRGRERRGSKASDKRVLPAHKGRRNEAH